MSFSNLVAISSLVLELLKKYWVSVASGTPCTKTSSFNQPREGTRWKQKLTPKQQHGLQQNIFFS